LPRPERYRPGADSITSRPEHDSAPRDGWHVQCN